ncbi:MAG: lysostaphin resistance A-like protein [Promethearchaeota archaeon]
MLIEEKNETWLNFFTPAVAVAVGGTLLGFLNLVTQFVLPFAQLILPFELDIVTASLLILFLGQIIGAVIVFFVLIPFFRVKKVEYQTVTGFNVFRTILLACLTYAVGYLSSIIFVTIFLVLGLVPQSGYGGLFLTAEHLANPLIIVLYFAPLTVGAAVFEELIYRRMLIPLLEERGMAPFTAVVASSLIFAFGRLPNDLMNGNLAGAVIQIWNISIIGLVLGLTYILTRNILFSMFIHGVLNFVSVAGPLVLVMENNSLSAVYRLTISLILLVGIAVAIFAIWQYFRVSDWVNSINSINEKPAINILPGLVGFLIIAAVLKLLPLIMEIFVSALAYIFSSLSILFIILLGVGYSILLVTLLWLVSKTKYTPITEKTVNSVKA